MNSVRGDILYHVEVEVLEVACVLEHARILRRLDGAGGPDLLPSAVDSFVEDSSVLVAQA